MYKIIALDMDGTLLDHKKQISDEDRRALKAATEAGVHIVMASGRCSPTLWEFAEALELHPDNFHIISLNGAVVFDGYGNKLRDVRMERELSDYIIEKIASLGLIYVAYYETDALLAKLPSYDAASTSAIENYYAVSKAKITLSDNMIKDLPKDVYKILIIGEHNNLRDLEAWMKENAAHMDYAMFLTTTVYLEFTSTASDKAAALELICDRLSLDIRTESIAIGDGHNDISMIKAAAVGACMANGAKDVKACADYITEKTNRESGVAEVVWRFALA